MRTTITIQDSLLERAKRQAVEEKCTLGDIVNDALRARFSDRSSAVGEVEEPPLKTYGAGGVNQGVDLYDNAALQDFMDQA
ncbi:MAG: hypothetical protein ACSHYA_00255 [Opitutaceae bacterium]